MSNPIHPYLPPDVFGIDWDSAKNSIDAVFARRFGPHQTSDLILRMWPKYAGHNNPTAMLIERFRRAPAIIIVNPAHWNFIRHMPQRLTTFNYKITAQDLYGAQLTARLIDANIVAAPSNKMGKRKNSYPACRP